MIVERDTDEFKPIQITLESELEAEAMWYLLKMPTCEIDRQYRGIYRSHSGLTYNMWLEYDRTYRPCDKKAMATLRKRQ